MGAVTDGGRPVGAALGMLLTTAGEAGPRSMRLSSVASLRTCRGRRGETESRAAVLEDHTRRAVQI